MKEVIVSRQNPLVKTVCSLLEKKHRKAEGLFRFDGAKLFYEACLCGLCIEYVIISENANQFCMQTLEKALEEGAVSEDRVYTVSASVFDKISEERSPEGIVTVAKELSTVSFSDSAADICETKLLLAESLRDPGNLGTVIRSCAALGIERLIISSDCADIYNPKTIRAAMGGLFRLKITVVPQEAMARAIEDLRGQGRCVWAAALRDNASELGSFVLGVRDCFVIGNEGHGLSDSVIDACDGTCIIPMMQGCESLNASAAAAICIWETVRA